MKQWSDLFFILTKADNTTLTLGSDKYPIAKNNDLFNSLLTFENMEEERKIPIEVYINSVEDINEFINFFEVTKYNNKYRYSLTTFFNGNKYNSTITTDGQAYEVTKVEDLYGTETQPTSTIKLELVMNDPFFYSDFSYDEEIGAGTNALFKFPYNINNTLIFSQTKSLQPHVIENEGNEDNGVIIIITSAENLKNPKIQNDTTGLSMGFNLSTSLNDIIVIDTIKKKVELNGLEVLNVKNLFDKWLRLEKGKNQISFSASSGAERCKVRIKFYKKYRGIGRG